MSLAFHTSLDILMLVLRHGVEFFFSMLKEGGENHLIWDRVGVFSKGCLYPPLEAVSLVDW